MSVASTSSARILVSRIISPCWHGVKGFSTIILVDRASTVYYLHMDEELIRRVRSELARQGGLARAKALTPKQRRDSAIKASKAAAKVRMKKGKAKKQDKSGSKET